MTAYAAAIEAAVAIEHQVVYGYGVAGAHLRARDRAHALDALTAHRLRRDRLEQLLVQIRVAPPVADVAYALPFQVTDASTAQRLCAQLEQACTGAAWDVAAASSGGSAARVLGVAWLAEAATAVATWSRSATTVAVLPGAPARQ